MKTYSRGSAVWQAEGVMRQRGGELRGVDPAGTAKTTSSYDLSSSSVHGRVSRSANTHIIYMHTHTRRLNLGRTEHPANKIISKQPLFVWPSVTSGIRFRIFSCMTNKYVYRWLRPNGSRLRRCCHESERQNAPYIIYVSMCGQNDIMGKTPSNSASYDPYYRKRE